MVGWGGVQIREDKPATDIEFNQFKANSIAIALSISVSIFSIFDFRFRFPVQDFDLYHGKSRNNSIMLSISVYISICITVSLYHCITVSLYHSITVSLYHLTSDT